MVKNPPANAGDVRDAGSISGHLVLWAFHPNVSILKDFFSGVIARL